MQCQCSTRRRWAGEILFGYDIYDHEIVKQGKAPQRTGFGRTETMSAPVHHGILFGSNLLTTTKANHVLEEFKYSRVVTS
jgi:hypothetical protein